MELNNQQPERLPSNVPPVAPAYWTSARTSIYLWLKENANPLAELYKGAVCLIFEEQFPGRLRFISHAVREIRNGLPNYISTENSSNRLDYKDELDNLLRIWKSNGFSIEEALSNSEEITIKPQLFNNIQKILNKHKAVSATNKEKAIRFFESCIAENKPIRDTLIPIVEQWWEVTEWFMERAHDSGKNERDSSEGELYIKYELFESFLGAIAHKFYETTDEIDKILEESNLEQLEKAIALIIHPQQRNYFFNHLQNPEWINPLKRKGFFQNCPQIIEDTIEGTVRFPMWSESRYLARMALHKPQEVLEILLQIETNNPSIHSDFIEAALQMPTQEVLKLVPKIKSWIESSDFSYIIPEKICEIIIKLTKEGSLKKALILANSLLDVMPDNTVNHIKIDTKTVYTLSPKPRTRLKQYYYQEIINKYITDFVKSGGEKAWKMLVFKLNDAVKWSIYYSDSEENQNESSIWEDDSHHWLPAIQNYYPNSDDIRKILVEAVKDTAKLILNEDNTKIRHIVAKLEERRWRIFHRIALYLIYDFPNADPGLLLEKIADHKRFTENNYYEEYEYALLLRDCFSQLPTEEQEKVFSWIDNPDIDCTWLEDQEKKAQRIKIWQLNKLTLLKNYLTPKLQELYNELIKEFGAVDFSKIVFQGVSSSGFRLLGTMSPKSDSELESISIEELVFFLGTWEPNSTDPFKELEEPSRQGLGSALARVAEKNPERYAQASAQFQGLHPKYLTNLLRGLYNALNNQSNKSEQQKEIREFDWTSVISLCHWIVEESEEVNQAHAQTIYDQPNSYWIEAARTVADLLGVGLTIDKNGITFNLREQVWKALKPLTQHPDPTLEREINYRSSSVNYSGELTINAVRSQAMDTVVRYALWIRRHFEQVYAETEKLTRGFDEMQEVREVLNEHLNLNKEPSLAIHSIYGRYFPWLALLDPHWANQNVGKIFPHDETSSNLYLAAWKSYIISCPPYDDVFDLLHEEYRYAVEQLSQAFIDKQKLKLTNESLVQHLMSFYWYGKLNLDDTERLLARFFEIASDELRGYALEFLGKSLHDTKDPINPQILTRLQSLWEKRVETARNSSQPSSHTSELVAFGWWFGSGKFNDSWAMKQLKQIFELVDKVEPDFLVLKRLATLAEVISESSVDCLRLMIEKDAMMEAIAWNDKTRTILVKAMKSSNNTAIEIAKNIIDKLLTRGFWEYRDLLSGRE